MSEAVGPTRPEEPRIPSPANRNRWSGLFNKLRPNRSSASPVSGITSEFSRTPSTNGSPGYAPSTVALRPSSLETDNSRNSLSLFSSKNSSNRPSTQVEPTSEVTIKEETIPESINQDKNSKVNCCKETVSCDHMSCVYELERATLIDGIKFCPIPLHYKLVGSSFLKTNGEVSH
ncbi:MAG: hypothetical protein MHPSP_003190, partial [Paramarteilia canceri]